MVGGEFTETVAATRSRAGASAQLVRWICTAPLHHSRAWPLLPLVAYLSERNPRRMSARELVIGWPIGHSRRRLFNIGSSATLFAATRHGAVAPSILKGSCLLRRRRLLAPPMSPSHGQERLQVRCREDDHARRGLAPINTVFSRQRRSRRHQYRRLVLHHQPSSPDRARF